MRGGRWHRALSASWGILRDFLRARVTIAMVAFAMGVLVTLFVAAILPDRRALVAPVPPTLEAGNPEFHATMNTLFGSRIVHGNAVETLVNGDAIFPAMLEAVSEAERTVNFETYVFRDGRLPQAFLDAFSERARAGVEVRLVLDWYGSRQMSEADLAQLEEAGVLFVRFRPIAWHDLDRANNRTHRKILVVDGRVGFIGGANIGDEWLGDARNPDEWRETHFRLDGPAVAELQAIFAENWEEATGELLLGERFFPDIAEVGDVPVQIAASETGERNVIYMMLLTAIASARDHVRIGVPYFVPDDISVGQLRLARARGVAVDVLVPGPHMDKEFVLSASRQHWGALLEAGVRIHEYQPTMYHAKIVVVDEAVASIGSANFDERTFRLNDEANLFVYDPEIVAEQVALFEADLALSREVTLEEWRERPFRQRLTDWAWSFLRVQF